MANTKVLALVEFLGRRKSIDANQILWVPSGKIATSNKIVDLDNLTITGGSGSVTKADIIDFNENDYVHIFGNESIDGDKTFNDTVVFANAIIIPNKSIEVSKLNTPNSNPDNGNVLLIENNEAAWGRIYTTTDENYAASIALLKGTLVTIDKITNKVIKLDSSNISNGNYRFYGIVINDTTINDNTGVATNGVFRFDNATFSGPSIDIYADTSNPGKMTETKPLSPVGGAVVPIGFTLDQYSIRIIPTTAVEIS